MAVFRIFQEQIRSYLDMARTVSLLALGLFLAGCAAPLVLDKDGALVVIPHEISDEGHILVETTVDGYGPFRFIVDTGASISVLYEKTRANARIEPLAGAMVRVHGITGSELFEVADSVEIAVGNETWDADRLALLPDSAATGARVDGILGLDFLRQYAIHYSQEDKILRFYPRDLVAQRSYMGWHPIPVFEMNVSGGGANVIAFNIEINGRRVPTIFDLGASVNLMNRSAARMLGVPARTTSRGPDIYGVTGKVEAITELLVWQVHVADLYWSRRTFFIGNFPIFDALDVGNKPIAVAGTDLFRDRDFIIDFERDRILVGSKK